MTVSLRYALLGLLSREDATGYELNQKFNETMIHFWYAHHSQIYRELLKMEEEGLVSSTVVPQEGHPDKKVYTLQEKGYHELIAWLLNGDVKNIKLKDAQLLKISLFHLIPREDAIRFLEKSKAHYLQLLEELKAAQSACPKPVRNDEIGGHLTLEYGVRVIQTWIDWSDWAIAFLQSHKPEEE